MEIGGMERRRPRTEQSERPPRFTASIVVTALLLALAPQATLAAFVPNGGQAVPGLLFVAAGGSVRCGFSRDAVVIALREPLSPAADFAWPDPSTDHSILDPRGHGSRPSRVTDPPERGWVVKVRFAGANASPVVEGEGVSSARFNFLLGNDPSRWKAGLPSFDAVVYRDLWPGVDLRFTAVKGKLEYRASCRSGASMPLEPFVVEGATALVERSDGSIRIETPVGSLLLARGAGESPSGERSDPSTLAWSTFLGGSGSDYGTNAAFDAASNPVVAGFSASTDFPVTPGAFQTTAGGDYDIYVAKLAPGGDALDWCTFIGGGGQDLPCEVCLDPTGSGDIFVTGKSESSDFPTTPGVYDRSNNGDSDAILLRLSGDGSALRWSTFFGGTDYDRAGGLAVDPYGVPTIGGFAWSPDLPTTPGAYDTTFGGGWPAADAFVARFSADGSTLIWSTYLGGTTSWEFVEGMALDAAGNVIVGGPTMSSDFPTTPGAFDPSYNGGDWDGYAAKLTSSGSDLIWSTYLGGSGFDIPTALAREPVSGDILLTGQTWGLGFPTTLGAYDRTHNGDTDAFVTRFAPDGASLIWSTFIGGSSWEEAEGICLGAASDVWITGGTDSNNFPVTPDAYDTSANGTRDGFVARLSSDGTSLLYGTYLGGATVDWGYGIAVPVNGHPLVTGFTDSSGFPTTAGAFDTTFNGHEDAFVSSLNAGVIETPCFYLDFDDDGDPYTIRTGLPEGTLSAPVRFILEVPRDSPRGEAFRFRVTEDCCNDSLGVGHYGVRLDPRSVAFEPAIVDSYSVSVPWDVGCAAWLIDGRFAFTPLPPPGERLFIGQGEVDVLCEDSPPCDLGHDFQVDFDVPSGSSCARNQVEMRTLCPAADAGAERGIFRDVTLGVPYPSPAGGSVRVELGIPRPARVLLQAYDVTGRHVATIADRSFGAGRSVIRWEAGGLPRGVYFLRADALGVRRSRMVVLSP